MARGDATSPQGGRSQQDASVQPERGAHLTYLAFLEAFTADVEKLSVGGQVILRRMTGEDKALVDKLIRQGHITRGILHKPDFTLETRLSPQARDVDERFGRVVRALLLIKPGTFGVPLLLAYKTEERALKSARWPFWVRMPGSPYSLDGKDADELQKLVQQLAAARLNDRQDIALRRFELASQRWPPEDRLIDYWIALEALFLPGISDELSFRASLRIAYYLTSSPDERQRIFARMRLSYDTRSRIVHGKPLKAHARQVASDTEDILRRVLRAEVMNPGSLNVDRLDAAIARGEAAVQ